MPDDSAIDLTRTKPFTLGPLHLRPPSRELIRGASVEILEPRVMQVLIALAQRTGEVVTRDELIDTCWSGRIVGEDAIHRVLSRLRRVTETIASGVFRIDTVTKSGYRLTLLADTGTSPQHPAAPETPIPTTHGGQFARRVALVGVGGLVIAIAGARWFTKPGGKSQPAPPSVEALIGQAELGLSQQTPDGQNQAIGLLKRVVELEPDYAGGWGRLAYAYLFSARYRSTPAGDALRLRGNAAVSRALELDEEDKFAKAARSIRNGTNGHWLGIDETFRSLGASAELPALLRTSRQWFLSEVGRNRESLEMGGLATSSPNPNNASAQLSTLWSARRFDEAERFAEESAQLFPTHFGLWFRRCYFYLFTGRPERAIQMIDAVTDRPIGIPANEFAELRLVAQALQSRTDADIDKAMSVHLVRAREGSGRAENAIQFASALGRMDDAFVVARAYYFGDPFVVPEVRFSQEQGTYLRADDRLTGFLFNPACDRLRLDERFDLLVEKLGLDEFWRKTGLSPDYLRQG